MTTITREQFEALRPSNENLIAMERDGAYAYEVFLDNEGNEVAFASYRAGEAESFTLADGGEA